MVKCGSFGHNIRSRPNLKASPVGRLTMANQITVIEEVCYLNRAELPLCSDGFSHTY